MQYFVFVVWGILSVQAAVVREIAMSLPTMENIDHTTEYMPEESSTNKKNDAHNDQVQTFRSTTILPTTTQYIEENTSSMKGVNLCLNTSVYSPEVDQLTQDEFTSRLTDGCRYDRLIKPDTGTDPVDVYLQIDMLHIESSDQLQLKAHMMVQLSYHDERLRYNTLSPHRGNIMGEEPILNKIWVPHIVVKNERESSLMGLDRKDVFVQIDPHGNVVYSYRMTVTFYCWMNLKKFPFDYQICEIIWASWAYNLTSMKLHWKKDRPFQVADNLHLTEYVMDAKWTEWTIIPGPFLSGGLTGNYSAVIFKFKLRREVGYYIMDYFLPSVLLVCTSWVTFWLQADASAPRVTLGTATMLSFITLNGGLTKNLPKVSYIKASEIWFLGCSSFIFCSMAEFAFVNVIWRRRKKVELKKNSSKYILKGAVTPSLARKQLRKSESFSSIYKTRSCSSLDSENRENEKNNTQNNYLTVHSFPSIQIPTIKTQSADDFAGSEDSVTTVPVPGGHPVPPAPTWTTMTPHEVANWIDRKSRIVFPVCFIIFNILYWGFVYAL